MQVYWVPASAEDFLKGRSGLDILAIVNHRMVGTLKGTDATFQSTANREVSTHFGVGKVCDRTGHPDAAHVHQYVDLSDTAFGNGNDDSSGVWDDWGYPTTQVNARTVSIEHEDNGHLPVGDPRKGIVTDEVINESIRLQRLLLTGDIEAMRAAGIRIRDAETARQLGALVPGPRTIINHHDIAGRLKPYCWKPWAADKVGFPQARYLAGLADQSEEESMLNVQRGNQYNVYAVVKAGTILRETPSATGEAVKKLTADSRMGYVGYPTAASGWRCVVLESPDPEGGLNLQKGVYVPKEAVLRFEDNPAIPVPDDWKAKVEALNAALAAEKTKAAALAAENTKLKAKVASGLTQAKETVTALS